METPYNSIDKLKEKFSDIYEISKLNYNGDTFYFFDSIAMFVYNLDTIIKSFPLNSQLLQSIEKWIEELDQDIKKEITTGYKKLTKIHQEHRILTRAKLRKIRDSLKMELETENISDIKINPLEKPLNDIGKETKSVLLKLSDLFESESKYAYIMQLLVEKGKCQPVTLIWKDEKNGNKSVLASLIKHLHKQGYYKNNKCPNPERIKEIAQNTFGCEVSVDTIKRAKPEQFLIELSFIPPASN